MRKTLFLSSAALIAVGSPAFAADTSVEPVVVTATHTPQPIEVTGTSISVITVDESRLSALPLDI